jgi:hypothetical protein
MISDAAGELIIRTQYGREAGRFGPDDQRAAARADRRAGTRRRAVLMGPGRSACGGLG